MGYCGLADLNVLYSLPNLRLPSFKSNRLVALNGSDIPATAYLADNRIKTVNRATFTFLNTLPRLQFVNLELDNPVENFNFSVVQNQLRYLGLECVLLPVALGFRAVGQ